MKLSADKMSPHIARALGVPPEEMENAFRQATGEDLPSVIRLRKALKEDQILWDDEKYLMWRFFDDSQKECGSIPYWVFIKDGEVIAGLGLEHVQIILGDEEHPAVRCIDVMVHPQFDGLGLGAFMNLVILEQYPLVIAIDTNEQSTNMVARMFSRLDDVPRFVTVCRLGPLLRQRYGFKLFSKAAGFIGDRFFYLKRKLNMASIPAGIEIRSLTRFEANILNLNVSPSVSGKILTRRDEKHLNWRFMDNPRRDYRILGAFHSDKMLGYVVFCSIPADTDGISRGRISDWLYDDSDGFKSTEIMRVLFESATEHLHRDGVHIINALTSDTLSHEALHASGFRKRGDGCPFFVQAISEDLKPRLTHSDRWFLTSYDNDVE